MRRMLLTIHDTTAAIRNIPVVAADADLFVLAMVLFTVIYLYAPPPCIITPPGHPKPTE